MRLALKLKGAWRAVLCAALVLMASGTAKAAEWAVLASRVNGQDGPEIFVLQEADGEIFIRQDDLTALRLVVNPPVARRDDGYAWVSVNRISGLTVSLDTTHQVLELMADIDLLPVTRVDSGAGNPPAERLSQTSGFINWSLEYGRDGTSQGLNFSGEAGIRAGSVLLQATGTSLADSEGGRRFVRLTTTAVRDWSERQVRVTAGDFFVQAPELAGGANLGGLSLARMPTLDPTQARRSTPQLRGQLLYPSEVEVYVDGRPVRREQLPAGRFDIQDLNLAEGGRSVQLVTRDPFGRVQTTDYSFYASESLLRQGASDYQYALGALRRNYGLRSADYGPWAFSAYHRVGLTPQLTLGGMVQGRDGLLQGGMTGVVPVGLGPGLLAWSVVGSRTDTAFGHAASVRYNVQRGRWGIGATWRQDGAGYAALADPVAPGLRRDSAGIYGSLQMGDWGSLSLSHSREAAQVAEDAAATPPTPAGREVQRSTNLGWSRALGEGSTHWLRVDLTRTRVGDQVSNRVDLTLTMSLDRRTRLTINGGGDAKERAGNGTVQLSRPLWPGETWGWELGLDRSAAADGNQTIRRAAADMQARYMQLHGDWRQSGGDTPSNALRLTAGGGVAIVGGGVYFSRPIGDAYAIARVGGLADVPITVNGVAVGRTNAKGELLVPQLNSYYDNQLGVDSANIPIDYALDKISRRIILPERTGAVVEFNVTRVRALEGQLVRAGTSEPVPSSLLRLEVHGKTIESATSASGDLYLENLPVGRHAGSAALPQGSCRFIVTMPDNDEPFVSAGTIPCEVMPAADTPPARPPDLSEPSEPPR